MTIKKAYNDHHMRSKQKSHEAIVLSIGDVVWLGCNVNVDRQQNSGQGARQSGTECEVTGRDLQVSVDLPNLALACRRKSGSITRGRGGGWVWMQHRKDPFGTRQDGQTNLIDQFQNHKRNLLVEG